VGGGTPSNEKKAEAEKMRKKRADSPASSARIVGRRYRDELDMYEQPITKHFAPAWFRVTREAMPSKLRTSEK
jgi:hypothetical protein